jgi:CDP-diacylglycerol--glycerol-3-phosphate 3-phosphatidyltransferase
MAALPNFITLVRIAIAVPALMLILDAARLSLTAALVLMIVAELSDWLDGYLARRLNAVSRLGKLLDPLADSLYRSSIFIGCAGNGWIALWIPLVTICRDVAVAQIRVFAGEMGCTMHARRSGKLKALAQASAQIPMVLAHSLWANAVPPDAAFILSLSMALACLVTVYSLLDYIISVYRLARLEKGVRGEKLTAYRPCSVILALLGPVVFALINYGTQTSVTLALGIILFRILALSFSRIILASPHPEAYSPLQQACESMYGLSIFLAFVGRAWMHPVLFFVIVARDVALPYLRGFARQFEASPGQRRRDNIVTSVHSVSQAGTVFVALKLIPDEAFGYGTAGALSIAAAAVSAWSLIGCGLEIYKFANRE